MRVVMMVRMWSSRIIDGMDMVFENCDREDRIRSVGLCDGRGLAE